MDVFFHDGHCSACHAGANFTDGAFHNIGIGYRDNDRPEDVGRGAITQLVGDRGRFRTPSLRDLDRTAPYMHDGSLATLEEVVEFYNHGGIPNPQLDEEIYPLGLSDQQKSDLIEFLRSALRSSDYPSARGSGSEDSI